MDMLFAQIKNKGGRNVKNTQKLKTCDNCPDRWSCIIACPDVNEILASIDIELCEKENMK